MTDRPEAIFQKHIADYLTDPHGKHGYFVLEASDITDKDYYLAESILFTFLKATQAEKITALQTDYGTETLAEISKALKKALISKPLWLIMRNGLEVKDQLLHLYYPKPRSSESIANQHWQQNRFHLKTELVIQDDKRPDLVLFLNGLPIMVIELKHEAGGQNVHDAVSQFNRRNHDDKIFQLPFLYVAMDTSDIKVATNPKTANNFRWYNAGLENHPQTAGEYPVEFFYRDVLAKEAILGYLSFYLVYVQASDDNPSYSLFPRYHQSRLVDKLAADIASHFEHTGEVGKKYLINHSAGSGKTLTISWLAERLHSLYKQNSTVKLFDMVLVLTDRIDLDKNIRNELDCFSHLSVQMAYAKNAEELSKLIAQNKPIIVTTIQKFQPVFDLLSSNEKLKSLRVAFLIDEAHRSQEGKNARAIRNPFKDDSTEQIEQAEDGLDEVQAILKAKLPNQLFAAFTATPVKTTVELFGKEFDTYSEAEAIAEGYILDVAAQIISYETLYNLHIPAANPVEEERLYPKGIVSKLLKQVAFEDEALIQYKAEVILRTFEEQIKPLIEGKAKAMVVASSRMAGLHYFNILTAKIAEKHQANPSEYNYKVLYAFSDFTHRDTNEEIREHAINGLEKGEKIEERFKQDDYRIMVVASKFQTGFNEPLLAGMFLDKPVMDKNAVQTLSRLNRCYEGKNKVIVLDFTNNTTNIIKAFNKYRQGTKYQASEPDAQKVIQLYDDIIQRGLFTNQDATEFLELLKQNNDATIQTKISIYRQRLQFVYDNLTERKSYVYQLEKLVTAFNFLSSFYDYPENIQQFVLFAEIIHPQLIKEGSESELMKDISRVLLNKAAVKFLGEIGFTEKRVKSLTGKGGNKTPTPPPKTSLQEAIDKIKQDFQISDAEAIIIREVLEEKQADPEIVSSIQFDKDRPLFLNDWVKPQIKKAIIETYEQKGHYQEIYEDKYIDDGAIFDMMSNIILTNVLSLYSTH